MTGHVFFDYRILVVLDKARVLSTESKLTRLGLELVELDSTDGVRPRFWSGRLYPPRVRLRFEASAAPWKRRRSDSRLVFK